MTSSEIIAVFSSGLATFCVAVTIGLGAWCLAISFDRHKALRKSDQASTRFLKQFSETSRLADLFYAGPNNITSGTGAASIFHATMAQQIRLDKAGAVPIEVALFTAQRQVAHAIQLEVTHLDHGVNALGTIAAITPFVGLLGTVAGIVTALTTGNLADSAQIDHLIQQIGEALTATGVGLFVAIGATYLFNDLQSCIANLVGHFENFSDEIIIRRATELAGEGRCTKVIA